MLTRELAVATTLARRAGALLLDRRGAADLDVAEKAGGEVVTDADRGADAIIRAGLAAAFPGDALHTEESPDTGERLAHRRVWIVDPLDGTSTYVAGGADFCVSIGLAVDGRAVAGVVFRPVDGDLVAGADGHGVTADGRAVRVSTVATAAAARVTTSRRDIERGLLPDLGVPPRAVAGMALKLARVASGRDDAVVSAVPRKEWGTCAGVALVLAAGGRATLLDGSPIRFNRAERRQPTGMLAAGPALHAALLTAVREVRP